MCVKVFSIASRKRIASNAVFAVCIKRLISFENTLS